MHDTPRHGSPSGEPDERPSPEASTPPPAGQAVGDDGAAPGIAESLRQFGASSGAGFRATGEAFGALRSLITADVSLARSAFGRTLAFTGVAIAFGASAWLLLMAALIAFLAQKLGMPWSLSLLLTGLLSAAFAVFGGMAAMRYFEHTRLQATRRQLARLGVGELAQLVPGVDSGTSAKEGAENAQTRNPDGSKRRNEHGLEVTPP